MAQEILKINGVYMGSQEIASTRFAGDAVAYYRGEGNANDSTANAYNGTATDITYGTAYGKFGQGMLFNGTSSKIALPDMNASLSTAVSFSFWAKITDTQSTGYVWVWQSSDSPEVRIIVDRGASLTGINWLVYDGGGYQCNAYAQIANSSDWHHYVCTAETNNFNIYIDGVLKVNDASGSFNFDAFTTHNIGYYAAIGATSYLKGCLDDVAIFSRALTSDEIYSLYKTGVKKLNGQVNLNPELESTSLRGDANLVSYWRMEGNSLDETANNNDGTDTSITYGTAYGKHGQGALLNGSSSKISLPDSANYKFTSGNFAISSWIKLTSTGNNTVFNNYYYNGGRAAGYKLFILSGEPIGTVAKTTTEAVNFYSGTTINDGNFHHLVVQKNGNFYQFYKDGNYVSQTAMAYNLAWESGYIARIGCSKFNGSESDFFNGSIDDLSIFSRALTTTEISNLYNTNIKKYNQVSNV